MNTVISTLFSRKSVRSYTEQIISEENKNLIIESALQAPSAGNQILYTIIEIDNPETKSDLSILCDNQPFINEAKLILIFLADCQRWVDCYKYAGVSYRKPGLGDILLACEDAVIAAQNTIIAAESLGIGSCYIGDILENKEKITELLGLGEYVLPITMVVYGYPTEQQKNRVKPKRFDKKYIVQKNKYRRLSEIEIRDMFKEQNGYNFDYDKWIKAFCERKYMSNFAMEMTRSVGKYLDNYKI